VREGRADGATSPGPAIGSDKRDGTSVVRARPYREARPDRAPIDAIRVPEPLTPATLLSFCFSPYRVHWEEIWGKGRLEKQRGGRRPLANSAERRCIGGRPPGANEI
jgi:hypothetical protein